MTGPIKPPSTPTGGPAATSAVETPKDASRADFRTEALTTPEIPSATRTAGGTGELEGALATIAKDLQSGRIAPHQAVDALVGRVLDSPMAAALSPAARTKLESVVRAQLADDPTLAALVADLGRGR